MVLLLVVTQTKIKGVMCELHQLRCIAIVGGDQDDVVARQAAPSTICVTNTTLHQGYTLGFIVYISHRYS